MNKFYTIARGRNPEEAFTWAQLAGLNGREIQKKESFVVLHPDAGREERPMELAFKTVKKRKIADAERTAGCILLQENLEGHPPGVNGYLFFGY